MPLKTCIISKQLLTIIIRLVSLIQNVCSSVVIMVMHLVVINYTFLSNCNLIGIENLFAKEIVMVVDYINVIYTYLHNYIQLHVSSIAYQIHTTVRVP